MKGWLVNDWMTRIEGTVTLWGKLLDWLPGLKWKGDRDFGDLGYHIFTEFASRPKPSYIIRNATYFGCLDLPVPTIALLQDIMPEGSVQRADQIAVCKDAALVVFNSAYTRSRYPELEGCPFRIIPLPVDFELFKPMPEVDKRFDVCWIGAASSVKGWDILCDLMRRSDLTFRLVMKDKGGINNSRVEIVRQVTHADLPRLINECRVGMCTSREETQHLAGIEMGGCGLPLVVTNVGAYWERPVGVWQICGISKFGQMCNGVLRGQERLLKRDAPLIAEYWKKEFNEATCKAAWEEAVQYVTQIESADSRAT